jgi:hypothetical protein
MTVYIRIRSWHIVRTWTRVPGRAITLCGRSASGPTAEGFGDDASCETCLRIAAKAA